MSEINIVLIEPEIPQNTGNIARTCAVTGASLHLVEPLGFKIDNAKLKRAGLDYWDSLDINFYSSLDDFFEKFRGEKFYFFTQKGKYCYTDIKYPEKVFIVFGKESVGLSDEILTKNIENTVRIPMKNSSRCLNLSNSVAVATYEVLRQRSFHDLRCDGILMNNL